MAKRKPAQAKPKVAAFSMNDAVDLLSSLPEIQEAGLSTADIELALDDRGWLNFGKSFTELNAFTRALLVNKSRVYAIRDPLCKQAIRLWTVYALSNGLTFKAEDAKVQKKLDAFWKDRRNKQVLSSEGQRKSSKKLLTDGEIFFLIFDGKGKNNTKLIRRLDPLQITDILTDPDDDEHVLAYRRQTADNKVLFYQDWALEDEDISLAERQKDRSGKTVKFEADVLVYHLPYDPQEKRGNGLLSAAIDWSEVHRKFMADRAAITKALAKFAFKGKVKGGQKMLNAVQARLQSTLATSAPSVERNPAPVSGSTWLENDGIDLSSMPRVTGAGDAKGDSDSFKLMVSAATGIMLHYFGDPSTGNLATATAMELPMLKMFESYQQLWLDATRDIFSIVLEETADDEPAEIDIDLPPILSEDLEKLGTFMAQVIGLFPELKVPEVLQMLLVSMGINNVNQVMEAAKKRREEIDAEPLPGIVVDPNDPNGPPTDDPNNPPVGKKKVKQPASATKQLDKVTEAMNRLAAVTETVLNAKPVAAH